MDIREALKSRRLFFDGGTGTFLQQYGLKAGEPPVRFNIENPAAVIEMQRLYLEAGSDVITANTFGAYEDKYADAARLIEAALNNARTALANGPGYIALDIGPTGRLLKPMGDLDFEECCRLFKETARRGADCGADLIIIETMTDLYELKAAVLAAKSTGLPVFATMTFDERGRSLTGADAACMTVLLEGLGADVIGMNCGYGPAPYEKLLPGLLAQTSLPVILQPNAGLPVIENGKARYDLSAGDFASFMADMAEKGVRALGGCCGTTPAYISATAEACKRRGLIDVPRNSALERGTFYVPQERRVCSGSRSVDSAGASVARCQETDIDGLVDEAMELAGTADIVEINVADAHAVTAVQELVRVPLSLNADNPAVLLAAVRLYNGCPMVPQYARALAGGSAGLLTALASYGAVIR